MESFEIKANVKTVNGQAPDSGGNVEVALNDLSGTLPLAKGGTGATTALDAVKALLGSGNVGSDATPIYYSNGKLVAGNYTFRLNHNTSDTWIPVFSSGAIDYVLKSEIGSAWTGGGIVAANLNTNGYVKFANGLILQWGIGSRDLDEHSTETWTYPISVSRVLQIGCLSYSAGRDGGSFQTAGVKTYTTYNCLFTGADNGSGRPVVIVIAV